MEKYCQSCGMPMENEEYGRNADGSKSADFCVYCYSEGEFTDDCTMDEMIDFCVPTMIESNAELDEDSARKAMQEFFPTLKRWK